MHMHSHTHTHAIHSALPNHQDRAPPLPTMAMSRAADSAPPSARIEAASRTVSAHRFVFNGSFVRLVCGVWCVATTMRKWASQSQRERCKKRQKFKSRRGGVKWRYWKLKFQANTELVFTAHSHNRCEALRGTHVHTQTHACKLFTLCEYEKTKRLVPPITRAQGTCE
jgi:hypothetical protein